MMRLYMMFILFAAMSLACYMPNTMTGSRPAPTATETAAPIPSPLPTATSTAQVCTVTATHLNMRAKPGMNAAGITVLDRGEVVTIHTTEPAQASWIFVTARGLDGWINQNFCKGK